MACDRIVIRPLALSLVLGLLMAAIPWVLPAAAATPDDRAAVVLSVELPDRPTVGVRLFSQKSCVRCHSINGGERRVGPDLGRVLTSGTVLDLAGALWNHAPIMREKMEALKIGQPQVTGAEMADLVSLLTAYRYYLNELGQHGDAAAGKRLFAAKRCGTCHGESETDWSRPGPSLERYRGRFSAIFLAQTMWNHGAEMAAAMRGRGIAWPRFEGREMGDLLAYLAAGTAGPASSPHYFEPGNPRHGRTLFKEKGCLKCHAIAGVGGRGGPDLYAAAGDLVRSVPAIAGVMWNHSIGMTAAFERRRIPRVTFSGQEMVDVIAYLYFIGFSNVRAVPARGAQLFETKCGTCHRRKGAAVVRTSAQPDGAPDLLSVPGLDDPFAIMAAMWNHAPRMENEFHTRGLTWPRLEPGQAADLAAHLLSLRGAAAVRR